MRTPVHSLVQELIISLSSQIANDTIPVQVSDRRGRAFYEVYADFVSGAPKYVSAINPSFDGDVQFNSVDRWRGTEKFEPGAGVRNIVYYALNCGTRSTEVDEPTQITFHDPATIRSDKSRPASASTSMAGR